MADNEFKVGDIMKPKSDGPMMIDVETWEQFEDELKTRNISIYFGAIVTPLGRLIQPWSAEHNETLLFWSIIV
jgi:hypothetical protein